MPENDVWREMPGAEEAQTYTIKREGMFSADYHCYKGNEASEDFRQLFINKTGGYPKAMINIENFYRETNGQPTDPDDSKRGQILWHTEFADTPRFDQHLTWGKGRHQRQLGFFDGDDSDDDDEYFCKTHSDFQRGYNQPGDVSFFKQRHGNGRRFYNKFMCKWSTRTHANLNPGANAEGVQFRPGCPLVLEVFAKGTATRIVETWKENVQHREETVAATEDSPAQYREWTTREVRFSETDKEFVDWIEYKLTAGSTTVAVWRCNGNENRSDWTCPIFTATNASGNLVVDTAPGWDPVLGLALGVLCANEYSPSALKADFRPEWPDKHQYRNGRRPWGVQCYNPMGESRPAEAINGSTYPEGISLLPHMFCAMPGYVREYYVNPAPEEEVAPPVLVCTPAHCEVDPETGLLVFKPISWAAMEPPPEVEIVVEEQREIDEGVDEGPSDSKDEA